MRQIDTALPMAGPAVPEVTIAPQQPASRAELLELVTRLTQEAKMPPSVKNARFVRVPAHLYLVAADVVRRELASLAEQ
jgi:hypothetical protein